MKEQREKGAFIRKCSVCGKRRNKSLLVRIARLPSGEVILDRTQKSGGRGAYICNNRECFEKAAKTSRPAKVLGIRIPDTVYKETDEYINGGK